MALTHVLTAVSVLASLAAAQGQVLGTILNTGIYSPSGPSGFGYGMVGLGDVDGDGLDDMLFPVPRAQMWGATGTGLARVALAAPAATFRDTWGLVHDYYAVSAAGGRDIDGDGIPDYVVGAITATGSLQGPGPGKVFVYSGATGALLRTLDGTSPGDYFGVVTEVADCNGDGYADVLGGTNSAMVGGVLVGGELKVQSGRDGSLLWTAIGPSVFPLLAIGDVDGDGCDDLVTPGRIRSGRDGSLIRTWSPPVSNSYGPLATIGDVDGDGVPEFLCGAVGPSTAQSTGAVGIISGATGLPIRVQVGLHQFDHFGMAVAGGFYADGDDVPDYAVRADTTIGFSIGAGRVEIYSGATGALLQSWQTPDLEHDGGLAVAGDADGDGTDELVIGATSTLSNPCGFCGIAYIYQVAAGPAGSVRSFGRGCPDGTGRLPTAEAKGRPRVGSSFDLLLRAGQIQSAVIAVAGTPALVDLGPLGAPGCFAHTAPFWWSALPTDLYGRANFTVVVPNQPTLIGYAFDSQWVELDPAANALGIVTSTAVRARVGP